MRTAGIGLGLIGLPMAARLASRDALQGASTSMRGAACSPRSAASRLPPRGLFSVIKVHEKQAGLGEP